jgi:hypothetical protein
MMTGKDKSSERLQAKTTKTIKHELEKEIFQRGQPLVANPSTRPAFSPILRQVNNYSLISTFISTF